MLLSYHFDTFALQKKSDYDIFFYLCIFLKNLRQYGGFDYLKNHWWALHIQNPFWVEREMFAVCRKNGGLR